MSEQKNPPELTDDIEIIGPGQLLADARKQMGLTQEQVAKQLNFRLSLVKDLEEDKFDPSVPLTFNRGYLRNYARLVNVPEADILSSYDMLGVAEKQGAEMQSFSRRTSRQAEHSRLKWLSYLILIFLIASTVLWFLQENGVVDLSNATGSSRSNSNSQEINNPALTPPKVSESTQDLSGDDKSAEHALIEPPVVQQSVAALSENAESIVDEAINSDDTREVTDTIQQLSTEVARLEQTNLTQIAAEQSLEGQSVKAVFTFAGDCWVNIYDATGERLAWGVKKAGYVMTISGVAPFNVTLGKPELVSIDFAEQPQDMSQFSAGMIAKFTLPLSP